MAQENESLHPEMQDSLNLGEGPIEVDVAPVGQLPGLAADGGALSGVTINEVDEAEMARITAAIGQPEILDDLVPPATLGTVTVQQVPASRAAAAAAAAAQQQVAALQQQQLQQQQAVAAAAQQLRQQQQQHGSAALSSAAGAAPRAVPTGQNERWRLYLPHVERLLDAEGILLLRQTCRLLCKHKYRPADGVLSFGMFRGVDARILMEQVVPLACKAVHPEVRAAGLSLDFSGCSLLKDASVARLMDVLHGRKEDNIIGGVLKSLCLDFCYEVTNKGLAALLTTHLPYLERLSLRCARSNELTFTNVATDFSADNWPNLLHFDASFTNMRLDAATVLADCLLGNAAAVNKRHRKDYERKLQEEKQLRRLLHQQEKEHVQHMEQARSLKEQHAAVAERLQQQQALLEEKERALENQLQLEPIQVDGEAPSDQPEDPEQCAVRAQRELVLRLRQQLESLAAAVAAGEGAAVACQTAIEHTTAAADAAGLAAAESLAAAEEEEKHPVVASLEIVGSLASKCLLSKVGMETHYRSFCHAVKLGLHDQISSLTKVVQKEFTELCASAPYRGSSLLTLQAKRGSELLVNAPFVVDTSEDGGVNVLTLPVSIAIQTQDQETLKVLIKRGAQIDVCDYLGKSPLLRACEASRLDLVEALLDLGVSPNPHDLRCAHFPLQTAIRRNDAEIVKRLLARGAALDVKCPGVRTYKSALCVACEVNSPEIISIILKAGGDPNSRGHNSYTPTLMAYQLNPKWLPLFLEAGAGAEKGKRWVLTDVLSCAVAKNDVESIGLLIDKYPDLMNRTHPLWSKPLLQAAKQGRVQVLELLLASGCNVDARGEGGQTALLAATEEGLGSCVERLIDHGADVNKANFEGMTPLIVACMENHEDMVNYFLDHTQEPYRVKVHPNSLQQQPHLQVVENAQGEKACEGKWILATQTQVLDCNKAEKTEGETPLLVCIRLRNDKIAKTILKKAKSIDLEAKDSQGRTALLAALFFGQYSVAATLMEMGADVMTQDEAGNTALAIANERLLTPGSDKRVLRRFLRLYRSRDTSRRHASSSGMLQSMLSALRDEGGSSSHVESDSGSGGEGARFFRKKSVSRSSSRGKQNGLDGADPRVSRSDGEVHGTSTAGHSRGAAASPSSSSRKRSGKKLKIEPKTVLQVAKLPMSLFRAAKAK
ncbi:ankyrin repeat-containing protein, putative [Eimeria acervulina]|uniref:Ankyrin repeat-containing protein, putative n=1 Tax=Eimeria acervulina TaxID=5801 RepID=U6GDS4_EIMAC|nr:ankyrin repeat-containing protein, putative [Eimeria acervulina]CDI78305.1 ankyrin repeat-containing protein, putative [Eimeria acervulina]